MTIARPTDNIHNLSTRQLTTDLDDLQRDHWADTQGLPEPECFADVADMFRVIKDLRAEGHDPERFDVRGLAVHMRAAAGLQRHLDTVSDEEWTLALEWHQRAPMPIAEVPR
ncbi:hypothetical protein [Williamsia sp. 1135]|uniref:hypothetical protein n=1 Tax=Williamsia sp. 1135 TaxID=1889262 RepID=UPI000A0F4665|nr:hypothetical protein [Williamsia sp. 1135]ORM37951.1 hypothetical protein BFL43_02130 [Williamsia sp. 1135]